MPRLLSHNNHCSISLLFISIYGYVRFFMYVRIGRNFIMVDYILSHGVCVCEMGICRNIFREILGFLA